MRVAQIIETKLAQALHPTSLKVLDDSARHAGHTGAPDGGQSHFKVEIVSAEFTGQSRLARQRRIYALLADEMKGSIHALSVIARAPGEG
jgi:BolA family transcriptional regulator, general stress-responsive regulator